MDVHLLKVSRVISASDRLFYQALARPPANREELITEALFNNLHTDEMHCAEGLGRRRWRWWQRWWWRGGGGGVSDSAPNPGTAPPYRAKLKPSRQRPLLMDSASAETGGVLISRFFFFLSGELKK